MDRFPSGRLTRGLEDGRCAPTELRSVLLRGLLRVRVGVERDGTPEPVEGEPEDGRDTLGGRETVGGRDTVGVRL